MSLKHLEYDTNGFPSFGFAEGGALVFTSGSTGKKSNPSPIAANKEEEEGKRDWVLWGPNDDFPDRVWKEVRKSGVARSALQLLMYKLYGQKVVPVIADDIDPNTNELKYTLVKDKEIQEFMMRSNFDNWRLRVIQDYVVCANSFPMIGLQDDRKKVAKFGHDKARKFRYAPFDQSLGRIPHVYRSANFPTPKEKDLETIQVIDSFSWYDEVDRIFYGDNALRYVFPTYFPDFLNDYYSLVYWDGVRSNGWLEISNSIPAYKRAIFKNQTTIKYHVKIPYSYWTSQYNNWAQMAQKDRDKIVNDKLDEMDRYLTGSENAMKTFISHFNANKVTGKSEDGWDIEVLDDKVKGDAYLPDSAAANAEILFSMLVNPALFGVGMPGGSYTGGSNSGGSNIRESWLVMNAINSVDRTVIYQLFDFTKIYNKWNPELQLLTLDKVLTTTDTGKGSKIVS